MDHIIGVVTNYHGDEHPYLRDSHVKVVALLRGDDYATTDDEVAALGGLRADDRLEVQPWLAEDGRYSFVTSDPLARDLTAFAALVGR